MFAASPEERLRSGDNQSFSEILEAQASEITGLSLGSLSRPQADLCTSIIREFKFLTKAPNWSYCKELPKIGMIV